MDPSAVKKSPSSQDKGLAHRALIVIGIAVAIVVLLALLWYVVDVLLLAFAGILLAIVLRTPADWLSRHSPLSPGWSLAIVVFSIVGLLAMGGWLFGRNAADQMTELFSQALPQSIATLKERLQHYQWGDLLIQQVQPAELVSGKLLGKLSQQRLASSRTSSSSYLSRYFWQPSQTSISEAWFASCPSTDGSVSARC